MTQARDLADGKFDTNTLVVDAANNRVGIGQSSPESALHITSSSAILRLTSDTNSTSGVDFGDSDDTNIGRLLYDNSDNSMRFTTTTGERLRVLSGGGLTFNGDTATANALDDYEEGTWTPAVTINDSTTGITYNAQEGAYTKVGRLVTLIATLHLSSKGSSSGGVKVTGLPFNVGDQLSTSSFNGFASVYWGALATTTSQVQGWLDDGATHILMRHVDGTGNGSVQGLTDTDLNNTTDFRFFIQYYV